VKRKTLRRTDVGCLEAADFCFLQHISGCALWHNESGKTMPQLGMRKSDKQIH
jgi:hypothetical protein